MANLAYTLALEQPKSPGHRFLGKLLASSLIRTFFDGRAVIFRSEGTAYFQVERAGLEEVPVGDVMPGPDESLATEAWKWKYKVAAQLDTRGYD
jgi:hypothetical protein